MGQKISENCIWNGKNGHNRDYSWTTYMRMFCAYHCNFLQTAIVIVDNLGKNILRRILISCEAKNGKTTEMETLTVNFAISC